MEIEVRLFATLRQGRFDRRREPVAAGGRLGDVLRQLALDPRDVAIKLVNGREAELDQALQPGDVVSLFPAVGGG
jgi:sulfur-carrier protein